LGAELIRFLLVGFVAGWIATVVVRGRLRTRGCITHLVVGMVGAVIGGYLFKLAGLHGAEGFFGSVTTATVGAIVLLVLLRLIRNA
jgi:uncharacterized membrane protein YeaQ/YmgE (transglycosylase-associated protein family)